MVSTLFSNDLLYAISWTLVHSLWQIAIVAILLSLILRSSQRLPSNHRYVIAYGSLFTVLLMSLITFTCYYSVPYESVVLQDFGSAYAVFDEQNQIVASGLSFSEQIEYYTPLIVSIWIVGAMLFLLKLIGGFFYIKNLVSKAQHLSDNYKRQLTSLKDKYAISRLVKIKESASISTPMVMGYIKPVILFPLGLVNQLTPQEVESILAHELAHVKRHDFLLNVLQMFIESIFYFHPGIWFISNKINMERENCCDDLAIQITGSNVSYAKTLVKLQDLKLKGNLKPALAFSGNKKAFTNRIMRILNQSSVRNQYRDKILALFLVFASLVLGANNWEVQSAKTDEAPEIYFIDDCLESEEDIRYYLDTIPEKNSFHIKKITEDKDVELEMEDGEITKLKINGEEIPESEFQDHQLIIRELSPGQNKNIITVLPECDEESGNVFIYRSDDDNIENIDALMGKIETEQIEKIRKYWTTDEVAQYQELQEMIIDTIEPGVYRKKYPNRVHPNRVIARDMNLDIDIMDLVPDKLPKIMVFPEDEEELRDIVIRVEELAREDVEDELEDIVVRVEEVARFKEQVDEANDIIIELKDELNEERIALEIERSLRDVERELNNQNRQKERIEIRLRDAEKLRGKAMEERERAIIEMKKGVQGYNNANKFFEIKPGPSEFIVEGFPGGTAADRLTHQLLSDQLIDSDEKSKIELTGKHLKINGDKQPKNIWKKYKKLYEEYTGIELSKSSKLKFEVDPDDNRNSGYIFKMGI